MKRLLVFFLFVSVSISSATTYYVSSSAGSDTNNGTSPSTPWKTIAKVNASTFSAGDNILFLSGDRWRETLRPPSSGAGDSPITFGGYGVIDDSTPDPIIDGSDTKAQSNWTLESGNLYYTAANIATRASARPTNVWKDGVKLFLVPVKASLVSTSQWYWDGANSRVYVYSSGAPSGVEVQARDYGVSFGATDVTPVSHIVIENIRFQRQLQNIRLYSWSTLASDLTFRGGTFYPEPGPDPVADTSAGIYVSAHASSLLSNVSIEKNVFDPACCAGASPQPNYYNNTYGVYIGPGPAGVVVVDGFLIDSNVSADSGKHNICVWHAANGTISNNSLSGAAESSIDVKDSSGVNITGNSIDGDGEYSIVLHTADTPDSVNSGSVLFNRITNNAVNHGIDHGHGANQSGGISVMGTRNVQVSYNRVEKGWATGIFVSDYAGAPGSTGSDNVVSYNVLSNNGTGRNDAGISLEDQVRTKVYNNTVYGQGSNGHAIYLSGGSHSTGNEIKNNILYAGPSGNSINVGAAGQSGLSADYNLYTGGAALPFLWGPTAYSFSGWKTASGKDSHSINADPKFFNQAAGDFRILPDSPAIDAGVNLGGNYGAALPPTPPSANTVSQIRYGSAWDIGAYVSVRTTVGRTSASGSFRIGPAPGTPAPPPQAAIFEAQLPQQWVNTHQWDHAINTPDRIKTIRPSGGDYTCNGATSALQAALDEAENWRIAHDQDTRIDIDSSCPAFVVHGTATQVYLKNLDNAGKYDYDEAIVLRSLNPPRRGVRVGYVAIKSDYRQAGRRYVQTYDPHGLVNGNSVSISNELGSGAVSFNADENNPFLNVTVTDSTHFNFAQAGPDDTATVTFPMALMTGPNTLAQWVAGNYGGFYQLQTDGGNAFPLYGQANSLTHKGPHGYLIMNVDVSSPSGPQLDQGLINLGTIPSATQTTAESGWSLGVEQAYLHGCAGPGIPTTAETLPHPIPCSTQGINKSGIRMFCGDCWFADSFVDQISEEGVDTHSVGAGQAGIGPQKIANNRLRGGSTTIHYGGSAPTIPGYNPVDLEIARNVVDIDPNWKAVSFGGQGPVHRWLIKNRIEFKTGNRILVYGNRFNYSWADGDQVGSMFLLTIRSNGQQVMLRNVTVENNLWQKSFAFLQLMGRDSPADGAGVSYSTRGILLRNNMITGTGDPAMTNGMGTQKMFPTGAGDWPFRCSAARSNNVETLTSCSFVASGAYAAGPQQHTDVEPDDSIRVYNCTDSSLNHPFATVISSTPVSLGPVTFSNPGANASGGTCTMSIDAGTPNGVRVEHNTVVSKGQNGFRNLFMSLQNTTQHARNLTYRNNLYTREDGANLIYCQSGLEGNAAAYAGQCLDSSTFEFHHNAFVHTAGLTMSHYSDWNPRGVEVTSRPTTWFPANLGCAGSFTANCPGFAGDYGTGFAAADYHDFRLHANSYFAAGHGGAADDGMDLGVNFGELDAAFAMNPYVCKSDCTDGGRNHGPYSQ